MLLLMITKETVLETIKKNVPAKAHVIVSESKWALSGTTCIKIAIAASDYEINGIRGQYPQCVSLALTPEKNLLEIQVFGGNGGQCVHLKPSEDSHLAWESVKIPFRRPKPNEKAVLNAIANFAKRWTSALKENKDRLSQSKEVDYDALLSS